MQGTQDKQNKKGKQSKQSKQNKQSKQCKQGKQSSKAGKKEGHLKTSGPAGWAELPNTKLHSTGILMSQVIFLILVSKGLN